MWRAEHLLSVIYRGATCSKNMIIFRKGCKIGEPEIGEMTEEAFWREVKNHQYANAIGMGPDFQGAKIENGIGVIDMKYLQGYHSLSEVIQNKLMILDKRFLESLLLNITNMIQKGHFLHMDLNTQNIMVNNNQDVEIIDFAELQMFGHNPLQNSGQSYTPIPFLRNPTQMTFEELLEEALLPIQEIMEQKSSYDPKTYERMTAIFANSQSFLEKIQRPYSPVAVIEAS